MYRYTYNRNLLIEIEYVIIIEISILITLYQSNDAKRLQDNDRTNHPKKKRLELQYSQNGL